MTEMMNITCYDCQSPLKNIEKEILHCSVCNIMMNKETLLNIVHHNNFQNPAPNETDSESSFNHDKLRSFSLEFDTQPCPSCYKQEHLNKIDDLLMFCSNCNHVFGYDDTTNFYDLTNFIPDSCQQEILNDIRAGNVSLEINCGKCNNSDPNSVMMTDGSDGKEPGLYCTICDSKMENDLNDINDLPDQCDCDNDPSILQFTFGDDGQMIFARCPKCGRSIEAHKQDEIQKNWSDKATYSGRVKIDTLDLIEPGCHIAWHQPLSYWHHAIVTRVYRTEDKIKVIHFNGPNFPNKGIIIEEEIPINFSKKNQLYRVDYKNVYYSNEEVIARAHLRLGESNYNIFTNNCESFAHWCKTGANYSQQFIDFFDNVRSQLTVGAVKNFTQTAGKFIAQGLSKSFLSKYALKAVPILRVGSTFVALGYHIFGTCNDIKKANDDRIEGKIDKKECIKIILKRVSRTVATGSIIVLMSMTGLCGTILGSVLSIGAEVAASGGGCVVGRALTTIKKLN